MLTRTDTWTAMSCKADPGTGDANLPDVLLVGDGSGSVFNTAGGLPRATAGAGNDVAVLSHYTAVRP